VYRINFYVPEEELDRVKAKMFEKGAGRIGDYEHCAWQVLGKGQFRPLSGSMPFIGEQGKVATVSEFYCSMVCLDEHITAVVSALKEAHPYETPAYEVIKLEEF
tara:strand:+ start:1029 stop:1340 length:312 start_codon:yes stop_codon:yes gene_type:complete